jgi:hypothetical protein
VGLYTRLGLYTEYLPFYSHIVNSFSCPRRRPWDSTATHLPAFPCQFAQSSPEAPTPDPDPHATFTGQTLSPATRRHRSRTPMAGASGNTSLRTPSNPCSSIVRSSVVSQSRLPNSNCVPSDVASGSDISRHRRSTPGNSPAAGNFHSEPCNTFRQVAGQLRSPAPAAAQLRCHGSNRDNCAKFLRMRSAIGAITLRISFFFFFVLR